MAISTLSGSYIDETYQRLVQYQGGEFADGTGSAITFGSTFPYTGSAEITGSLIVTGSISATLGFTGSLYGTALTASYIDGGTF